MHIKIDFWKILVLSLLLILISCSDNEDPIQQDFSDATQELDIAYGDHPLQNYDLYLPAGRSTTSTDLIILIHGGARNSGDKADVFGIVELLQATMPTYAIANINYRLDIDPNNLFADHMADVASVVTDLTEQNQELGISQNIIMAGVSAGGHMTLLYSYAYNTNNYVKIAANIIGPTYFLDPSYTDGSNPTYLATIAALTTATGIPLSDIEYYENASPLGAINSSSIPTIQFLGDQDPLIPTTQGTLLQAALSNQGIPNKLIIYLGEGHGWTNPDNWTDTAVKLKEFVEDNL